MDMGMVHKLRVCNLQGKMSSDFGVRLRNSLIGQLRKAYCQEHHFTTVS